MLDDILLIKQSVLIWKSDFPVWIFWRGRLLSLKCLFVFQLLGKQEEKERNLGWSGMKWLEK